MTSLLKLLFPKLEFPATVENFGARLEPAPPGDDREREERLIAALDKTAAATTSSGIPSQRSGTVLSEPKKLEF